MTNIQRCVTIAMMRTIHGGERTIWTMHTGTIQRPVGLSVHLFIIIQIPMEQKSLVMTRTVSLVLYAQDVWNLESGAVEHVLVIVYVLIIGIKTLNICKAS